MTPAQAAAKETSPKGKLKKYFPANYVICWLHFFNVRLRQKKKMREENLSLFVKKRIRFENFFLLILTLVMLILY